MQNFDGVTAPSLPGGFNASSGWVTSTSQFKSSPNSLTNPTVGGAQNYCILDTVINSGANSQWGIDFFQTGTSGRVISSLLARAASTGTQLTTNAALEFRVDSSGSDVTLTIYEWDGAGGVTSLATIDLGASSATPFESLWCHLTAITSGSTVKMRISRYSDGKFLNSSGAWVSGSADVLTGTTSRLSAGYNGIAMYALTGATSFFDNFDNEAPAGSATITEQNLPANHNGNITVHVVGTGTAWSSSTTWTPSGVAGWSVASKTFVDATHYTVVLTPPATASPPTGATGTLTLTEGVTGIVAATTVIGTPTLSISPTTAPPGSGATTITFTGANTLWLADNPQFSISGPAGTSMGASTASSNTASSGVLTVGGTNGTVTFTDPSTGAQATFTVAPGPVTVPITDANWLWSPYNWKTAGGVRKTIYNGAYFKLGFTGTSLVLNIDTTNLTTPSKLRWTIDGAAYSENVPTGGQTTVTLASGLAAGSHYVQGWIIPQEHSPDRWAANQPFGYHITSATIDALAATVALAGFAQVLPRNAIVWGDSITEGGGTSPSGTFGTQVPYTSYGALMALALNCEYGLCAFATTTWSTGADGVPAFTSSWNQQDSVDARVFSPPPDYAIVNYGTNGAPSAATVTAWLTSCRAAVGAGCTIVVIVPFGVFAQSALTTGVANYLSANPSDKKVILVDLNVSFGTWVQSGLLSFTGTPSMFSVDGLHPNQPRHSLFGAMCAADVRRQLGASTATARRRPSRSRT